MSWEVESVFVLRPTGVRTHWQKLLSAFRGVASSKVLLKKADAVLRQIEELTAKGRGEGSVLDLTEAKDSMVSLAHVPSLLAELSKLPGNLGCECAGKLAAGVQSIITWAQEAFCDDSLFVSALEEIINGVGAAYVLPDVSTTSSAKLSDIFNESHVPSVPGSMCQRILLRCCLPNFSV